VVHNFLVVSVSAVVPCRMHAEYEHRMSVCYVHSARNLCIYAACICMYRLKVAHI